MEIIKVSIQRFRELLLSRFLPPLVVFLALALLTFFAWQTARVNLESERTSIIQRENQHISENVAQRFKSYENILRGAAGLFYASNEVNRTEWQKYLHTYNISQRFPGVVGVGFAKLVPATELSQHVNQIRNEGYSDYEIFPTSERPVYTSIVYVDSFNGKVPAPYGYDMYTDPVRRKAMDAARDSGQLVITEKLTLLEDILKPDRQPGFIMYFPVYATKDAPPTVEQRRQALLGYTYAPFRVGDFVGADIQSSEQHYGFALYSQSDSDRDLIYTSRNYQRVHADPIIEDEDAVWVASRTWWVAGFLHADAINETIRNRPLSVLFGGALFSTIAASLVYLVISNRMRVAAVKEKRGIQEAKDELLALASHQLRTPATGVKQYVGMLREGFAGTLTPLQKKLLDKAYESNERQLGTINDMLFVARADAGNLVIQQTKVNLTAMVRDVIAEQRGAFRERKQQLQYKASRKPAVVLGDAQYLRMAFENILSNASKYTNPGGSIYVSLINRTSTVVFQVKDTGVGVSRKDQSMLFKKFSRINNDLSSQVSGSGIGLYLTKKIVRGHDGKISFESDFGKGSTVRITLPKHSAKKNRLT